MWQIENKISKLVQNDVIEMQYVVWKPLEQKLFPFYIDIQIIGFHASVESIQQLHGAVTLKSSQF